MIKTKAEFKAIRERVGLSQEAVAQALGNTVLTVKRWENPRYSNPPEDAWAFLFTALDQHKRIVDDALRAVEKTIKGHGGRKPSHADFLYYRTQEQYDLYGREEGDYMVVNARVREIAVRVEALGVEPRLHYPEEDEKLFSILANTRSGK